MVDLRELLRTGEILESDIFGLVRERGYKLVKTNRESSVQVTGDVNYILMPQTCTYVQGVQALRNVCAEDLHSQQPRLASGMVRPLSFKENIEARVRRYRAGGDHRTELLFHTWLDSCTGVAYKAGTSRMKIIPVCPPLVEIAPDLIPIFLPVNYDELNGIELDTADGTKYRELLTRDEVLNHPAWLAAVEGDEELLRDYAAIVFSELSKKFNGKSTGMRFWKRFSPKVTTDELRALLVGNLVGSDAHGNGDLNGGGSFAQVCQAPQR